MKFVLNSILFFLIIVQCEAQNSSSYALHEGEPDAFDCAKIYVTKNNRPYTLKQYDVDYLKCPIIASIHKNWLFFYHDDHQVRLYDLNNHTSEVIFSLYSDIHDVNGPFWSPDHSKVAFTIINQERNHNYKSYVRLIVYDFSLNGTFSNKQKYDIDAAFECHSQCWSKVDFIDNHTIRYNYSPQAYTNVEGNFKYIKL